MSHLIQAVTAKENYILEAVFFNGIVKQYDIKQLFNLFPQFLVFQKRPELFGQIEVDAGGYGVVWNDDLDLDAETIWENGILIEKRQKVDLKHLLAYQLAMAREQAKMTQKELSEKTNIYQADISKLERGIGNPSLTTLERIAEGLGVELKIEFVEKNTK